MARQVHQPLSSTTANHCRPQRSCRNQCSVSRISGLLPTPHHVHDNLDTWRPSRTAKLRQKAMAISTMYLERMLGKTRNLLYIRSLHEVICVGCNSPAAKPAATPRIDPDRSLWNLPPEVPKNLKETQSNLSSVRRSFCLVLYVVGIGE
jgi:hypothetical protein